MVIFSSLKYDFGSLRRLAALAIVAGGAVVCGAENPERPASFPPEQEPDSVASFLRPSAIERDDESTVGLPQPSGLPQSPFSSADGVRRLEPFSFSYSPVATLGAWRTGAVAASGSRESMNGLMGIESGRISIGQRLGPLTVTAWAGATKAGYFRGLQTAYGFGGEIDYEISDRWSVTAFGQYFTPLHPLTPAMAGYFSSPNFGGYASYNINDRWGISVGAQATRSLVTNRWEAQPIVKPYFRVNKKVAIGVDVGGIIYNLAKDYLDSRNNDAYRGGGAPPMHGGGVPRPAPARVAPRR